jgi:hypothetical protein
VHDERDDREQQKEMDEQASALEHHKATQPHHNQDNCKNEKHGNPAFFISKGLARRLRVITFSQRAR